MNIYHVERTHLGAAYGHEEYDSFICYARDEQQARLLHPHDGQLLKPGDEDAVRRFDARHDWVHACDVDSRLFVTQLGVALFGHTEPSVIMAKCKGSLKSSSEDSSL